MFNQFYSVNWNSASFNKLCHWKFRLLFYTAHNLLSQLRFVKCACLSVREIRTKINMNRQWDVLVQYWRYKSAILPPLPLWKMDQNIGILFLMNLFQNLYRLTRISLPYFLFDIRTRLLGNELNGVFVCKDVFNRLVHVSRPFEYWILCGEVYLPLTNYLIKFPPGFLTKGLGWVDYL